MIFLKSLQYGEFFAYVIAEAGALYYLLKSVETRRGRLEVLLASMVRIMNY